MEASEEPNMTRFVDGLKHGCTWLLLAAALVSSSGCTRALATVAYMWKGNVVDPDFDGLAKKKVAVVCRPVVQLSFAHTNGGKVDSDIARALGDKLRMNVTKLKLVDPQRVEEWTDSHEWNDYTEIGKGVGADMVVGIDLQDFQLYSGQTLYQGKAKATIKVYDMKDGGRVVYQKHLPQTVYPPNAARSTTEMQADQFRREFIDVLADEVGRSFYGYDAKLNYARDTAVLN